MNPKTQEPVDLLDNWQEELDRPYHVDDIRAMRFLVDNVTLGPRHGPDTFKFAQIGCWTGQITRIIMSRINFRGLHKCCRLFAVDTFEGLTREEGFQAEQLPPGEIYRLFALRMKRQMLRQVFPLRGDPAEAARTWPQDLNITCLILDGDPSYEWMREQMEVWPGKLTPHGFICGFGYGAHDGVTKAVDKLGKTILHGDSFWFRQF